MHDILSYTAWPMEKFKSYGLIHLSLLFIGVTISVYMSYRLRNSEEAKVDKILFKCGLFLLVSEIYKQLFYTFYIENGSYPYWIFPFQLCSVPMYLCLLLPFIKKQKIKDMIYNFMASYNLMGGFISFLEPSGLIHEYVSLTAHAFVWHMMLVFIGLLIISTKLAAKTLRDFPKAMLTYLCLCLIAYIINLIFYDKSNGTINMFFIGPANSSIIVFKDICKNYSVLLSSILFMFSSSLASALLFLIACKYNKLTH